MDSEVLLSISKNSKETTHAEATLGRVRLLSDTIADDLLPVQGTLPEEREIQRMAEPSANQTYYYSPFHETEEHVLILESRQAVDPRIIAAIETTCAYKLTETPPKNTMLVFDTLENPIKKNFFRFVLPILVANLTTFGISQLIYHLVLGKYGKEIFESLADYLYKTASTMNQFCFFSIWIGQYLARKNWTTNVIPETIHMVINFEGALAQHEPSRLQEVKLFSKHLLLMWLLTVRQFSQRMQEMYPDDESIQQELDLTVDELKDLEGQPPGGLFIFRWLLATITEGEFKNHFKSPADAKAMKQDVLAFRRSCENAAKFVSGRIIPKGFLYLSYIAVNVYGWLTVLGFKGEIGNIYFPSQNFLAYALSLVWFEVCRSIAHPFDDEEACNTVQVFREKLLDHKTFLEDCLLRFKVFTWNKQMTKEE